jgi:hypothetical protein
MKKIGRFLVLIAAILVCVLINVILFLTVPDKRLDTATFWLAWSFSFPLNLVVLLAVHLWTEKKNGSGMIQMPIAYWVGSIFCAIYLVVGLLFMYLPIKGITLLLILELIITTAYIILAMYSIYSAEYIMKSEKATKAKVLFIKLLQADINDCKAKTTNSEVIKELSEFAENVRFSDPMSHPSLSAIEAEISSTVGKISVSLSNGDSETALALIKTGKVQLEQRNSRCIILK